MRGSPCCGMVDSAVTGEPVSAVGITSALGQRRVCQPAIQVAPCRVTWTWTSSCCLHEFPWYMEPLVPSHYVFGFFLKGGANTLASYDVFLLSHLFFHSCHFRNCGLKSYIYFGFMKMECVLIFLDFLILVCFLRKSSIQCNIPTEKYMDLYSSVWTHMCHHHPCKKK